MTKQIRTGQCRDCGDVWSERGEIVVCPECSSQHVFEVKTKGIPAHAYGEGSKRTLSDFNFGKRS